MFEDGSCIDGNFPVDSTSNLYFITAELFS